MTSSTSPTAWIDAYVAWASKRSPLTPPHFHEGIAYTLGACAIAGRVCVQTPQGRIYPNLYTLLLGKTTVYAKSVAMDLSQELADAAQINDRVINSVFTPESIIGELAGEKPSNIDKLTLDLQDRWHRGASWKACRMIRLDEAGVFFNGLRRDYNAAMQDLWMKLYDCPATVERTTYKHGLHVIQQPVLSCLFATTPASIGGLLRDQNMWLQGFWPRWNFCVGAGFDDFARSAFEAPSNELQRPLMAMGNGTLSPFSADKPHVMPIEDAVLNEYEDVLEANRKRTFESADGYMEAVLGRLHTKRMKMAMILAALAGPEIGAMRLTLSHWQATERPVRQIELDMSEALRQCRKTEKATMEERITRFVKSRNGKASKRDVMRHTGLSTVELDPYLDGMNKAAIVGFENDGRTQWVILRTEEESGRTTS